jgi:hypothetical protein
MASGPCAAPNLPQRLGLPKNVKNKLVFAEIEGRGAGENVVWLVKDVHVV